MNLLYAKTLLYAYTNLEELAKQIDELVERKARCSMINYTPAMFQFESIIKLTFEKDIIYAVKLVCDKVLSKFTKEELDFFRYKYFKNMPNREALVFDSSSRSYFRTQVKLAQEFALRVERCGIDDKFFEEKCLELNYFKELLRQTEEHERLSHKNKKKTPKVQNGTEAF